MPPKSRICRRGDRRGRDGRRGRGRAPAPTAGCAREHASATRRAFVAVAVHAHRERLEPAQHEVAVERARHRADRVLQEADALGDLGVVRGRRTRRRRRSGRRGTWWSSARRRRRRARAAAAGTAWRTCCRRRRARRARARPRATAAMSTIVSAGWSGVSTHTSAVSSGQSPASASRSVRSATRPLDARRARAPSTTSRNVPPYASSGMTTWSPGREQPQHRVLGGHAAREREPVRARPRATPGTPRARGGWGCRCGRTRSPGARPTASCANVVDSVIGGDHRARRRVGRLAGVDGAGLEARSPSGSVPVTTGRARRGTRARRSG